MELPDSIATYLKAYSKELSDQILKLFPPLYGPNDTPSPILARLYRKAFKAQELAIMSTVRRSNAPALQQSSARWARARRLWQCRQCIAKLPAGHMPAS